MRRRRFLERRDAHQAGDCQTVCVAAFLAGRRRRPAAARRPSAARAPVLISTNSSGCLSCFCDFLGQRLAQAGAIDRMDGVEQRHRFLRLVGLQRADQVQLEVRMLLAQRRPFRLGLLHAVLAEHALAAAITGSIASAAKVFDTAISVTDEGSRPASAAGLGSTSPVRTCCNVRAALIVARADTKRPGARAGPLCANVGRLVKPPILPLLA